MTKIKDDLLKLFFTININEWKKMTNSTTDYCSETYNGYYLNIDEKKGSLYINEISTNTYTLVFKYRYLFWSFFHKNITHKKVIKIIENYKIKDDQKNEKEKNDTIYKMYESITSDKKMKVKLRKEKLETLNQK